MKIADNIAEHTFRLWAASKSTQPETPQHERQAAGRSPNARQISPEQVILKQITTAKA